MRFEKNAVRKGCSGVLPVEKSTLTWLNQIRYFFELILRLTNSSLF